MPKEASWLDCGRRCANEGEKRLSYGACRRITASIMLASFLWNYIFHILPMEISRGYVYDGHLRTPDEGGARVDFSEGNTATYDFSGELRRFQWGLQAGAQWRAFKHLTVHADLSWG